MLFHISMLRGLQQWIETIIAPTSSEEQNDVPSTEESEEQNDVPSTEDSEDTEHRMIGYFFPTEKVEEQNDGMKKSGSLLNIFYSLFENP